MDFSISPKSNQLPGHYYHRSEIQPIHTDRGPNASIIINYVRNGGILLSCQNCKYHELETANCPPIMINGIIRFSTLKFIRGVWTLIFYSLLLLFDPIYEFISAARFAGCQLNKFTMFSFVVYCHNKLIIIQYIFDISVLL